jgi:hypothetical protein
VATTRGGLYPDDAKFVQVVQTHGPDLKNCFLDQHLEDEWSMSMKVGFPGRRVSGKVLHKGTPDSSIVAERLKDCVYNRVAMWPWPTVKGDPGYDAGTPFIAFLTGLERPRGN